MSSPADIMLVVERVRRATRNTDVLDLCDWIELQKMQLSIPMPPARADLPEERRPRTEDGKFDKRAYQRNLMRDRRAKAKKRVETQNGGRD